MPQTAAIDNETLDHLLSVVDDSRSVRFARRLSKRAQPGRSAFVQWSPVLPRRRSGANERRACGAPATARSPRFDHPALSDGL